MYVIMYYASIVTAVLCFIVSVFLFFYNRIIDVIRYFLKNERHIPKGKRDRKVSAGPKEVYSVAGGATELLNSAYEPTEQLNDSCCDTEILNKAQDFATAILEADKTEILVNQD